MWTGAFRFLKRREAWPAVSLRRSSPDCADVSRQSSDPSFRLVMQGVFHDGIRQCARFLWRANCMSSSLISFQYLECGYAMDYEEDVRDEEPEGYSRP